MTTQPTIEEIANRVQAAHAAQQQHYATLAAANAHLKAADTSYTTSSANGACVYVFIYLQVDCNLAFPDGTKLTFNGKGIVAGLGGTGTLGGSATLNVPPASLRGASGITFQAAGLGIGIGGFQVTWFKDHGYIGHAEFYGLGVQLGTPGGGWGEFK
jgi:hypothetical protein